MNQKRSKEFRKMFKNRTEYKHFKERYTRSSLPLRLEVIAVVKKMKGKEIHHLEVPNGR